jgi:sterol desaturase/sphingolipid hydroxylase (fatty acid hydroxylase superfamily)
VPSRNDEHVEPNHRTCLRIVKRASSTSIAVLAGVGLFTLAWFTISPLDLCLECGIQTIWSQLHGWYGSSVPDYIRLGVWVILRLVPSTVISLFLDPYLYVAVAVIVMLEHFLPAERQEKVLSSGTIQDIFWFVMRKVLEVVVISVMMQGLRWVYDTYLGFLSTHSVESWPLGLKVALVILVGDFLDWFHHLLRHKVWFFWCFHSVHHSQRQMNMFTDDRVHPVDDVVAGCLVFVPLFMFSIEVPLALYLVLFLKWYPKLYHANVKTNFGWLKYVLVTPQSHRVHHSIEERHSDRNFGVIFSIWDRLFGTLYPNYDEYPSTGVSDAGFPLERQVGCLLVMTNYAFQMLYPFQMIQHRLKPR